MKKTTLLTGVMFAVALLGLAVPQETVVPNDPYFKYQLGFFNSGGKVTLQARSHRPSPKEFEASPGVDAGLVHAWALSTGKKSVVVALLDDGFFLRSRGPQGEHLEESWRERPGPRRIPEGNEQRR